MIDGRIAQILIDEEGFTAEELVEFEREIKGTLLYKRMELSLALKDAINAVIGKNGREGD